MVSTLLSLNFLTSLPNSVLHSRPTDLPGIYSKFQACSFVNHASSLYSNLLRFHHFKSLFEYTKNIHLITYFKKVFSSDWFFKDLIF